MLPDHVKRQIVSSIQQAADRIYHSTDPSDLEAVKRAATAIGTVVQAGQMTYANMVGSDLARTVGLKDLLPVDVSITERLTVSKPVEYERPFRTAIKSSVERGAARLDRMVVTDIQMGGIRQAQKVLRAAGRKTYHRVPTGDNPCALCEIASTRTYYTKDLLPIHPGCMCSIEAGPPEDRTIDTAALGDSGDQKKLIAPLIESGAGAKEYQSLVAVNQHGEIGSTIGWAHQKFTGPQDLPAPPSKEVLAQQAYDIVRANGGITIDLAGNQPHDGYAYAPYKTTEFKVKESEFTPKHVDDYIDRHHAQLARKGNNLGMWTQDGYVYLDVSKVGAPNAETFAKAQAAHQLAVFDLDNFEEINLGTIDPITKGYKPLGTSTDLHHQYREQVARADEAGGAGSPVAVPVGAGGSLESARAATRLKWDGPPLYEPIPRFSGDWKHGELSFIDDLETRWKVMGFDLYKDGFRAGARDAQLLGASRLSEKELQKLVDNGPPIQHGLGSLNDPYRRKPRKVPITDPLLRAEGREIVARAAASKPTTHVMYRGMLMTDSQAKKFLAADEISLPLSSFSGSKDLASGFGEGEGWRSQSVKKTAKQGVFIELQHGAKLAQVSDVEQIGFGRFKVVESHQMTQREWLIASGQSEDMTLEELDRRGKEKPTGKLPIKVTIKQTSMIEADVAQGNWASQHGGEMKSATKIAGEDAIPEFTIVKKPKVNAEGYEEIGSTKLYLEGVDPRAHQGIRDGLADFQARHPEVSITDVRISTGLRPSVMAQATPYSGTADFGFDTSIALNPDYFGEGKYEAFAKQVRDDGAAGWTISRPDLPPEYIVITHECNHGLDAAGSEVTRSEVNDILAQEFQKLHPDLDPVTPRIKYEIAKRDKASDAWVPTTDGGRMEVGFTEWLDSHPEIRDQSNKYGNQYRQFLKDNMSDYSFNGDVNSPFFTISPGETLAEAGTDVDINGDKASVTSKALQRRMVENATPGSDDRYIKSLHGSDLKAKAPKLTAEEKEKIRAEKQKAKDDAAAARKVKAAEREVAKQEAAKVKEAKAVEAQRKRDERNLKTYGTKDPAAVEAEKARRKKEGEERSATLAEQRRIAEIEKKKGFGSVTKRITEGKQIKAVLVDGKPSVAATYEKYSKGKGREILKENWRLALKHSQMWALEAGKVWYPELNKLTKRLATLYAKEFESAWGVKLTPDLVATFMATYSENNKWVMNLVGVRKFLDGTGGTPYERNPIGLTVHELLAPREKFTLDKFDYDKRKIKTPHLEFKKGKKGEPDTIVVKREAYRWLTEEGTAYDFHVDKSLRAIKNPRGGIADLRENDSGAPKPADFGANAAGDYDKGTADRWVARIMMHTEDDDFAESLRNFAITKDGVRDPVGYKLMSEVLEEVAAELGMDVAAAQAGPWIQVVGPSGAIAYIEDLSSVSAVNRETLRRVKEFGEVS